MWGSAVQICSGLLTLKLADEEMNDDAARCRPGGLAQLARAPALQAGGHRFDSDILHQDKTWAISSVG